MLAVGSTLLIAADVVLAYMPGVPGVMAGVALWGAHMGLSQGILASLIADVTAREHLGTAFGIFSLVTGLGLLAANALAGALWDGRDPAATFLSGALLATAATVSTVLIRRDGEPSRANASSGGS